MVYIKTGLLRHSGFNIDLQRKQNLELNFNIKKQVLESSERTFSNRKTMRSVINCILAENLNITDCRKKRSSRRQYFLR